MNPMEIEDQGNMSMEWTDDESDSSSSIFDLDEEVLRELEDPEVVDPDYYTDTDDSDSDMDDDDLHKGPYCKFTKYGKREQAPLLHSAMEGNQHISSTSMEVNTSLSDGDDYDEDGSMEWLSTSIKSTSLLTPKSPQCGYTSWLPGPMAKLPLELVYEIFDLTLLGHTPRLSHAGLHGLLSFRKASKHTREMVDCYMRTDRISTYFRQQLIDRKSPHCVKWYRSRAEASHAGRNKARTTEANPHANCDILTEIIVEDCLECYKLLGRKIPGLSQNAFAVNEYGWRFVAIAIRSGSYKILEHLLNLESRDPNGWAPITLLNDFADCMGVSSVTCIGMLAYQNDPIFAEKLLDLIGPLALRNNSKGWVSQAFTSKEKARLCKYITPRTAEWFISLGVRLWRVGTLGRRPCLRAIIARRAPGPTPWIYNRPSKANNAAWNAAVHNSPEFLEFLYKHDPEGVSRTVDNLRPIHFAVWANRVDTFKWLLRKMKKLDIKNPPNGGVFFNSTNRIDVAIARHTSPESEIMLKHILAGPSADGHNYQITGQFFKDIVLGIKEAVLNLAVRSDLDQDSLDELRFEHEQRAIRKAKAVSKVYFDTGHPMPVLTKADANARHADAINLGKTLGFGELENVFDSYSAI